MTPPAVSSARTPSETNDLLYAPATELITQYARKLLSPVDVTEAVLSRIEALNAKLECFVLVDGEQAMKHAKASESRWQQGSPCGVLDGVPVSIKDLLLTRGWPTLRGSRAVSAEGPWDDDAPAVARLREQGAVLVGKTATPEFGHKATTASALSGVTRNPWNPACTPGGSSGGASAAVACGMGPLALGTDGAGSVRIPSSFSGLFGHKATAGRVPAWPSSPFGTAATPGPLTRTVEDGALLFEVITGDDHRDYNALPPNDTNFREAARAGAQGLRVGFTPDFGVGNSLPGSGIDPSVAGITRQAVEALRGAGADVREVTLNWPRSPVRLLRLLWTMSCARLEERMSTKQRSRLDPGFRRLSEAGRAYGLKEQYELQGGRELNWTWLTDFFRETECDVLLGPTMPVLPFAADRDIPEGWGDDLFSWVPFTPLFNLTRHPAASVNAGFAEGLPVGVQVVAPMYQDRLVFQAAGALERELSLLGRRPLI